MYVRIFFNVLCWEIGWTWAGGVTISYQNWQKLLGVETESWFEEFANGFEVNWKLIGNWVWFTRFSGSQDTWAAKRNDPSFVYCVFFLSRANYNRCFINWIFISRIFTKENLIFRLSATVLIKNYKIILINKFLKLCNKINEIRI